MKHLLTAFGLAVLALALMLTGVSWPAMANNSHSSSASAPPANVDDIEAYFHGQMKELGMPGAALGIIKDDKVVHVATYGEADREEKRPVTATTPFKIGSTSKSFTALGVMQLVEEGKVDLDAPVQTYIPWFTAADAEASSRITVRHLLNQVSGFTTATGVDYMYTTDTSDDALEREVRASSEAELATPPGETWQYSNRNYTTLGFLIQMVSGQSYEDYMQQHVLEPLGMDRTYIRLEDAEANDLATGHQYWFGRPVAGGGLSNNRAITPTGLISSSVEDMSRYLIAHVNSGEYQGQRVLSEQGVAQLHKGVAVMGSGPSKYGMGWFETTVGETPMLIHNGDTGDFHTTMMIAPSNGYGVVVLMNGSNGHARADVPASGVMGMLMGAAAPALPSAFGELATMILLALAAAIVVQLAALIRSVVLIRRWQMYPARRPRGTFRMVLRIWVPALLSLVWLLALTFVLPPMLSLPISHMVKWDFGWLAITSAAIALLWGVIAGPLLKAGSVRPTLSEPGAFDLRRDRPVPAGQRH